MPNYLSNSLVGMRFHLLSVGLPLLLSASYPHILLLHSLTLKLYTEMLVLKNLFFTFPFYVVSILNCFHS